MLVLRLVGLEPIPWKRRPQVVALLDRLKNHERGFDAVVSGEPQRAFYGNQYGLTFPVFVHYGVQLWVPEVGGAIDPELPPALIMGRPGPARTGASPVPRVPTAARRKTLAAACLRVPRSPCETVPHRRAGPAQSGSRDSMQSPQTAAVAVGAVR